MQHYVLQHKVTGTYIFSESRFNTTDNYDNALLFKENIIKDKLKQYTDYRAIKYVSLGKAVSRY